MPWALPVVALSILVLMLVPAEVWHNPENDAVYRGFDPNLIYVTEQGFGASSGVVEVLPDTLTLTALPNSEPTVHLVTTPLDRVEIALNVSIIESNANTTPLRIGIWTPRGNHGYFLNFGPAPAHEVVAEAVLGRRVVNIETLGVYSPATTYRLNMSLDKDAGIITIHLTNAFDSLPIGSSRLRITGKTSPPLFSHFYGTYVPVIGGQGYPRPIGLFLLPKPDSRNQEEDAPALCLAPYRTDEPNCRI